jgi:hypothetical protein
MEPEKGQFRFRDEDVENARQAGITLVLQLCWGYTHEMQWAVKNSPKGGQPGKGTMRQWDEQAKAHFLKDVADFTYGIVSHYKGKVKYLRSHVITLSADAPTTAPTEATSQLARSARQLGNRGPVGVKRKEDRRERVGYGIAAPGVGHRRLSISLDAAR